MCCCVLAIRGTQRGGVREVDRGAVEDIEWRELLLV